MRNAPEDVVASWPEPNYDNPVYQGPQLLIVGVILLTFSLIVVVLRLWVRVYMKNTAGWDDWIMVAAVIFIICATVTANIGTTYGWGLHIWDVKHEWGRPTLMTSWFCQLLLIIIMTLVKLSLLVSYLRFLTKPLIRGVNWVMIAMTSAWGLAYILSMFLACIPLKDYWESIEFDPPTCMDKSASTLSFSITNMVTDLMVLMLPIPVLWQLKLPVRERLALIALMSMGLVACAASAVRVYYTYLTLNITYDITWDGYQIWLWILVEVNTSVLCASIPTLRPLLRRYFPKLGFRNSASYRNNRAAYAVRSASNPTYPASPAKIYTHKTLEQTIHRTDSTEALRQDSYAMADPGTKV